MLQSRPADAPERLDRALRAEAIVRPPLVRERLGELRLLLSFIDNGIPDHGERIHMILHNIGAGYFQAMRSLHPHRWFATAAEFTKIHEAQLGPAWAETSYQQPATPEPTPIRAYMSPRHVRETFPAEYFDMRCVLDNVCNIVAYEAAPHGGVILTRFDMDERFAVMDTVIPYIGPWDRFWSKLQRSRRHGWPFLRAAMELPQPDDAEEPAGSENNDGNEGGNDDTGDDRPNETGGDESAQKEQKDASTQTEHSGEIIESTEAKQSEGPIGGVKAENPKEAIENTEAEKSNETINDTGAEQYFDAQQFWEIIDDTDGEGDGITPSSSEADEHDYGEAAWTSAVVVADNVNKAPTGGTSGEGDQHDHGEVAQSAEVVVSASKNETSSD